MPDRTSEKSDKAWKVWLTAFAAVIIGFVAGFAIMTDYYGAGVLTVPYAGDLSGMEKHNKWIK